MRLILITTLCFAAAACSRGDENRARADVRDAGHDFANAARDLKNDPTVKAVGADARAATHDAAVSIRKGAAEAEVKTGQALVDAGDKAKRAAAQARADSAAPSRN